MRRREFSPAQLLTLHIAGLITVGGILPSLPASIAQGHAASVLNGSFTSTSAVCVTGLIVVDTPNYWSPFGQVVLMLLIIAGGLVTPGDCLPTPAGHIPAAVEALSASGTPMTTAAMAWPSTAVE